MPPGAICADRYNTVNDDVVVCSFVDVRCGTVSHFSL